MEEIKFNIKVRSWTDKATGTYIVYSRKYDICAYGETKKRAMRMLNMVIDEILKSTMQTKKSKTK